MVINHQLSYQNKHPHSRAKCNAKKEELLKKNKTKNESFTLRFQIRIRFHQRKRGRDTQKLPSPKKNTPKQTQRKKNSLRGITTKIRMKMLTSCSFRVDSKANSHRTYKNRG